MKKFNTHSIAAIFALLCIFATNANAQSGNFSKEQALQLVKENAAGIGFTADDINNLVVSDAYYDKTSQANLVYVQQTYKGVRIYNAIKTLAFRNGKSMSSAGSFFAKLSVIANSSTGRPEIPASVAVANAAAHVDRPITALIEPISGNNSVDKIEFPSYNASQQNIVAKLLWVSDSKGSLHLSWQVKFVPVHSSDYWLINVDAKTGEVINKDNLTVYDRWDKEESPNSEKTVGVVDNNHLTETPEERGSTNTNSATGSFRVVAYPAESPIHPGGAPSLVADPYNNAGLTNPVTAVGWNNDSVTDYNYTRGNNVWAREDRNGTNGSPTPGVSPTSSTPLPALTFDFPFSTTTAPTTGDNQKFAITQLFYWNNIMHDITYQYGFDEVAGNFQSSNLGRGGVGNDYVIGDAQDGGGTNNANFATPDDGSNPRMQMYLFTSTSPNRDGDLDNGVMGHEYAHGISNRLTGGPSITTCLTNKEQMGEGWSDYYALMTTTNWQTAQLTDGLLKRPLGTYVIGQPVTGAGIRTYPYSTDVSIDKWNYSKLATGTQGEVHNIGEIWATVLWDMTWNIIQKVGVINHNLYDANANGGNSIALKLVTQGLKLQACRPGFLDGRDGILKADTLLYNGQYSCAIWSAFARRGMGVKAKQGSSDSYTDQTADYTLPDAVIKKTVDKAIADQNQDINYTINVSCKCVPITSYKVVDTLNTSLVDYVSGGTYDAPTGTVSFTVPALTEGQSQSFNFTAKVKTGTYFAPATLLAEDIPGSSIPSTFAATATGAGAWSVSSAFAHSGTYSFKAADPNTITASVQTLTTTGSFLLDGLSTLSFYHYYNTEPVYDGGVVELSVNGGTTWFDAGPYMYQNGYNASILTDSKQGFVGNSGGFILTKVNLSAFKGKSIKIRFVFSSDANTGADGWYVDDINLENNAGIFNVARLFNASNVLVGISDTSTLITNVFPLTWGGFTAQKDGKTALLKWTTIQEQNTSFFAVERSTDGIRFESIGTVKAAGNSNTQKSYTLTDGVPAKGINYYRIRQVDKDGHFGYSETRSLTFDKANTEITITPNPAKDKIAITVPGNKKALKIYIYSSKGEKVGTFTMNGDYLKLNLPLYASGVYYVTIKGDGILSTQKLVIE